jgi:hypothetical protein
MGRKKTIAVKRESGDLPVLIVMFLEDKEQ